MHNIRRIFVLPLIFALLAFTTGCDINDNEVEKIGENVDEALNEAKDDIEDACEKTTGENC